MAVDLALRGATVVDGTGGPERRVDVGIHGGTIVEVGDVTIGAGTTEVDLSGLVLSPGFIDPHTHFDAQIFWDPDLTPSSWHGVTTVLLGNCGFGIAPLPPSQRSTIGHTLENVEGMSAEVLALGIPWGFESFPEYLDELARRPLRCNVGVLVGHTPVRMQVMGPEASDRPATVTEIAAMRRLVEEALGAGAFGFSTSRAPTHLGALGRPVPSRLASPEETDALFDTVGRAGHGIVQATVGVGLSLQELSDVAMRTGRPVTWTALFTGMGAEALDGAGEHGTALELADRGRALGGDVYPQIASLPQVMQVTLADPFPFAMLPAFREVLAGDGAARSAAYASAAWRDRARAQLPAKWSARWFKTTVDESAVHADLVHGPTLGELAAERGIHPFDLFLNLSLAEDLQTRFRAVLANDDESELAVLLRDPSCLLAVSDAGAHVSQLCDARYPTHLLRRWVRETGVISLPFAVWRMTGQPAAVLGLSDRGVIRPGAVADLVAFSPTEVAEGEPYRIWDLPGGADRLVAKAAGIAGVWVNGVRTVCDGELVEGARPGTLLRSGRR